MKKFDKVKTLQLVLLILLTAVALTAILRDRELFALIAVNSSAKLISLILWLTLGISFLFLLYDFNSYSDMRRENLELDNAVYSDALTGIANRYRCDAYIEQYKHKALPKDMGCVTFIMTSLKPINDQFGHEAGDAAIRDFSDILAKESENTCFIGRNGGNKFLAIFRTCSKELLSDFLLEVEHLEEKRQSEGKPPLRYQVGVAFDEDSSVKTLVDLLALSDGRALADLH